MRFTDEQLNDIFDRTDGQCHICHRKLAFANYGSLGKRGAWEVEHSNPRTKGGTNRLNNLYAACIRCNRSKGAESTRTARAKNGKSKAPMSAARKEGARQDRTIVGGVLGATAGSLFCGKKGAVSGAILGAILGYNQDPDE